MVQDDLETTVSSCYRNNSSLIRSETEASVESSSHFAFLQQNKNALANNVLWKRKEQLARWETSETNRLPSIRREVKDSKVKFTETDIFLSACLASDFDEVQSLLDNGADINTCTVDGLTALHQAVIDGKPEMVQFLCEQGSNLNAQDNEGWTPLHAAACCGNVDLVEYLCSEGADISVINSDKELAIDLAEEDDCRMFLEKEHRRRGIEPEDCRNKEVILMKHDAEEWLRSGQFCDRPHSRTGASALHVAAAKGYVDVVKLLLRAGADINCRDRDGWTPLHAAAHWGEMETAAVLIQNGASLSELTNSGESVLNVADKCVVEYLESCAQKELSKVMNNNNALNIMVHSNVQLKRAGSTTSVLRMSTEEKIKKTKLDEQEENKNLGDGRYSLIIEEKTPSPSVEARLPCPSNFRDHSKSPSEDERSTKSLTVTSNEEKSSCESRSASEKDFELTGCELDNEVQSKSPIDSVGFSASSNSSIVSNSFISKSPSIVSISPSLPMEKPVDTDENTSRSPSIESSSVAPARPVRMRDASKTSLSEKEPSATVSSLTLPEAFLKKRTLSTPPTEPNLPKESEAERRSKAKRQRDSRRSTQGVTREQLRVACGRREEKENDAIWNDTAESSPSFNQDSTPSGDSVNSIDISTKTDNDDSQSATSNSASSLPSIRRRSQANRNTRRGTGPISFDEMHTISDIDNKQCEFEAALSCSSSILSGPTPSTLNTIQSNSVENTGVRKATSNPSHILFLSQASPTTTTFSFFTVQKAPLKSAVAPTIHKISTHLQEIDYKSLYEVEKLENERLKKKINELSSKENTKITIPSVYQNSEFPSSASKSTSTSSISDQERRLLERRIVELEYEVKQLEHLRIDIQKLKEENGALIRVISKLSK